MMLALALIVVQLTAITLFSVWSLRQGRFAMPAFLFWLSYHYIGLPLAGITRFSHAPDALLEGAILFGVYLLVLLAYATVARMLDILRDTQAPPVELGRQMVSIIAVAFTLATVYSALAGYSGLLDTSVGAFAGVAGQITAFGPFVFAALGYEVGRNPQDRRYVGFAMIILGIKLGFALFAMFRGQIVFPLLAMLAGYAVGSGRYGRVAMLSGVAALALFFVITPFVDAMRAQTGLERASLDDVIAAMSNMYSLKTGETEVTRIGRDLWDWVVIMSSGMFDPGNSLTDYVSMSVTANLPSFLVPDKPQLNFGNVFGHQLFAIRSKDDLTNISPGVVAEAWSYGLAGVIVLAGIQVAILEYGERILPRITAGFALGMLLQCLALAESPLAHQWLAQLKLVIMVHLLWLLLHRYVIALPDPSPPEPSPGGFDALYPPWPASRRS